MESRISELRRRSRRVFRLSMLAAIVVHAMLFIILFVGRGDVPAEFALSGEGEGKSHILGFVDVHFGPPEIIRADGTIWTEPPERILEVQNINLLEFHLPPECFDGLERALVPAEARLRLELNASGRIVGAAIAASAGDACGDGILTAIAESLWYRWLPNESFPAPVDLIQPMRVVAATPDETWEPGAGNRSEAGGPQSLENGPRNNTTVDPFRARRDRR